MERLHLGRGFSVRGKVALDEVAVPRQHPDLFYAFLLEEPCPDDAGRLSPSTGGVQSSPTAPI